MKAMRTRTYKGNILVVFLLSLLLSALGAAAESKDILLFDASAGHWQSDYTQKVISVKGTLYIARVDGLYAWNMGTEPRQLMDFSKVGLDGAAIEGQEHALSPISELMSDGTALYALDGEMKGLWRFDEAANIFIKEAAFEPGEALLGYESGNSFYNNFLMDSGNVYYIVQDVMTTDSSLIRLDIKSGKAERLKTGIYMAVPYYPGKLIVANGPHGWPNSVSVLDLDTGSLMYKMDISNDVRQLYYEAGSDTLYIVRKGAIFTSVAFGEPKLAARIPVISPLPGGTHLNGGYAALAHENGVRVFTCDPASVTGETLTFVGQTFELPVEDYSVLHPDVTFAFSDFNPSNTAELVTHMMSGDGAADIYDLYASGYNFDALFEKGYFAGLEGSQTVFSTVDAMYPFIKDQLMREGRIVALPYSSNYSINMYNPEAFEEVGLSADDVPTTYDDLLDFIALWGEEYREAFSSMSLFGQGVDVALYKRIIARSIMEDRTYFCIRSGQPITYNTPEMQALLNKLMATDFEVINALAPDTSNSEYQDFDQPPRQLFHIMMPATTDKAMTRFFNYMPLKLNDQEKPVVLCDLQVLIVNPYSRHFDAAIAFVEHMAANLSSIKRADMVPAENEEIRDPYFDAALIEETITKLDEVIKTAKEEEKRSLQEQLDMMKQQLEERQRYEWLTTRESIDAFRVLNPYFMLKRPNPMTGMTSHDDIDDLFYNRFLQGQISAEQFLKELDQKMLMIEREN